ncbi:tetratricopeptide repeat protein [Pseudomonas sp. UMAB-40]|uniref:tetratricopeptide repeat protein n=1 Tax=Pseudomonas sp. UMAB-40 TaxID=1365407 RepID=UPI001C55E93A|nr:tetratricopeptide repeat protein [Pseudomonas sp. UMAB-40]
MEQDPSLYIKTIESILSFLDKNIWPLIILAIVIITRKSLASSIERLIKLSFSFAGASGAIEAASPVAQTTKPTQTHADVKEPVERTQEPILVENPAPKKDSWISQVFDAFESKDSNSANQLFEGAQRAETDKDRRRENEAIYLYISFTKGNDQSSLEKLEQLYKQSENDQQIKNCASWLSAIYIDSNDHKKDKQLFEDAISRTKGQSNITGLTIKLSSALINLGESDKSLKILEHRLSIITDESEKGSLYEAIAHVYKEIGNTDAQAIALEKSVEYSPGNRERLFNAAYAQSNENMDLLSVKNYLTLLNLDPNHATALNNLAVAASELKLPGKQVELLDKSKNKGSTLAMSNLANIYIESGLYDEAESILNEARKSEDPHENVGTSLYNLKAKIAKEQESWITAIKDAENIQRNIRLYGEAYFDTTQQKEWATTWKINNKTETTFLVHDNVISAEWLTIETNFTTETTYTNKLTGTIHNRSAKFLHTKKNTNKNTKATLLGLSQDKSTSLLAYITSDGSKINLFTTTDENKASMTLYRILKNQTNNTAEH